MPSAAPLTLLPNFDPDERDEIAPGPRAVPSFRAIFETHSAWMWNALRRLGVHERDLEDVAHEVFITVHRRLGDYDPQRPLRPWLFGIALRTAMRYRELARHRREVIGGDREVACEQPSVEDRIEAAQARRLVAAALESIEIHRRAVFVMHEIDGEPIPAVAEALHVPLNTAYSRLRLARADFRAAILRLTGCEAAQAA